MHGIKISSPAQSLWWEWNSEQAKMLLLWQCPQDFWHWCSTGTKLLLFHVPGSGSSLWVDTSRKGLVNTKITLTKNFLFNHLKTKTATLISAHAGNSIKDNGFILNMRDWWMVRWEQKIWAGFFFFTDMSYVSIKAGYIPFVFQSPSKERPTGE